MPVFSNAVAIIGMAGRFPDAPDLQTFWRNLTNGVESLRTFTDEELLVSGVPPELLADPNYVKKGTYLDGADQFDAQFFGLNAREAEILDPQQRLFLECAWEAIEDAGYLCDRYPGLVSVFGGTSINTYLLANLLANPAVLETVGGYQVMVANDKDFLSTRVSYKLNLRGAGLTIQTACSTSLVAVQLAWQSLLDRQCDLALAGGVSIAFPQKAGYRYQEGMIFSPDGHCRPFDEKGQGIRAGAGAGVVVLKRLSDALADGDPIRAVLLGAAINNDGAGKMGYTAPSLDGQAEVIALAQSRAGVDPGTITYIEAHGTATPLGDPIEVGALSQVFRAGTSRRGFCALGSVKSNLGHLDAAAGVAGLIKTVLSLEHQVLPPTLNFQHLNPQIDFHDSPFYINNTLSDWTTDGPRRAGVSSFGIGGTNAHVVLEEAPPRESSVVDRPAQLLVLSARTPAALDAASRNLATHLAEHPDVPLADVAYTLQVGRKRFEYRRAIVCRTSEDAVAALNRHTTAKSTVSSKASAAPPIAFLFSGQGSQYAGMGRELYHADPTFREELDRCAEGLTPHLGCDIRELILKPVEDGADSVLNQTQFAQPALFAIEYALGRTWMAWGIRPAAMLGHSIGEYVAACLSGVLSLEDALRLVAERGRLMQAMPAGRMIAVPLSEAEVKPLLDAQLSLAAVNGPRLCVVAGPAEAISTLERRLAVQGIECRPLHTSHAFHSAMMEPVLPPFLKALEGISLGTPEIPYISNLTGTWASAAETTQPSYWARHLRNAVRFADGLQELAKTPGMVFLEVGPGKTLATLARQTLGATTHDIFASLPHPLDEQPDVDVIFQALGQLWSAGVDVDWSAVHRSERLHRVSLPTYPFERQRYLVEPQRVDETRVAPRLRKNVDLADWFYVPSWARVPAPAERGKTLPPSDGGTWLIFLDDCGVGTQLADKLIKAGQPCVTVRAGTAYQQNDGVYTIRPDQREDYDRCITDITSRSGHVRRVLHLWSVTPPAQDLGVLPALEGGLFSVVHLLQSFGELAFGESLDVTVVSSGMHRVLGHESLVPAKAPVLAPLLVAPKEFPWLRCQNIDIDPNEADARLISQLLIEAAFDIQPSAPVAYRAGYRWAERYEPVSIPAQPEIPARLRERGVYLITGGLGGLGLVTARFLAETVQARLILTARSAMPASAEWPAWLAAHEETDPTSERIRAVQALEALGAEVLVAQADVTDRDAMERVVAQARHRFGAIHGVFHAAGLAGGSSLQMLGGEALREILASKIAGTVVLDSIFEKSDLELFVLFSSINTIIAMPASTDYTAGNFFLDSYATAHHGPQRTVLAIDWDSWQDVGMAASAVSKVSSEKLGDRFHHAIEPKEGEDALGRILTLATPRVVVATRELSQLIQESQDNAALFVPLLTATSEAESAAGTGLSRHDRPDLEQNYVAPQTEHEKLVAVLWQELLGIDRIGIDDDFFALGGHSLIATSLLTRIQRECNVKLPLRTIFEAPTVRTLAERVSALVWAMQPASVSADEENREEFEI